MMIRKANIRDFETLRLLFAEARRTIAALGIDQWQDGYPYDDVIRDGIAKQETYVVESDGGIYATFVLVDDGEPTYDKIYDGHWLTGNDSRDYVAIHRVVISLAKRGLGLSTTILDYAASHAASLGRRSLRIDTHNGNAVMRRMLAKHGFVYCGIVHVQNDAPFVAYELLLND